MQLARKDGAFIGCLDEQLCATSLLHLAMCAWPAILRVLIAAVRVLPVHCLGSAGAALCVQTFMATWAYSSLLQVIQQEHSHKASHKDCSN